MDARTLKVDAAPGLGPRIAHLLMAAATDIPPASMPKRVKNPSDWLLGKIGPSEPL